VLTARNLEALSKLNPAPLLVTSLYLNTEPKRFPKPALQTLLKDLVRDRDAELRDAGLTHDQLKSAESDFERLHDFLAGHVFKNAADKGLAAFSCAGRDFFQSWALPHGFRATLLTGPTAYLRPLTALLAQAPHAVAVLVDQRLARAFTIRGEEVQESFDIAHDTGGRVKSGDYQGKNERHKEHHHTEVVHHHYQNVADRLLAAFQTFPFDHLVLGGHLDELRGFERHLHSYLAERLTGRFRADVKSASPEEVRQKTAELVAARVTERNQETVQRLVGASRSNGGLAVTGLKNTLAALNDRRIQTLVVADGVAAHGKRCSACETLFVEERTCPRCSAPTVEAADVIDEAIALTVHQGGAIRILPDGSALAAQGNVGAMLRY
jgi:peptide chain release factor subunit 1